MIRTYKKLHWTEHSKIKMRQYGLSKTKLINLLYKPERKEKGIVPGTVAVMKTNKSYGGQTLIHQPALRRWSGESKSYKSIKKAPGEIWLMYKDIKDQRKIISAWRYPGVTKSGDQIPIPEDIKIEIMNMTD